VGVCLSFKLGVFFFLGVVFVVFFVVCWLLFFWELCCVVGCILKN
jgi:hypothetical protein